MPKCVIFDVRSNLGVQFSSQNFSLYMVRCGTLKFLRSANLSFSSYSKPLYSPYETVNFAIICTVDRRLYPLPYAPETFGLSHKLSSTVRGTFGRKTQFVQLSASLYKIWGVSDPQYLYPVISFFVPVMMQQTFSMQL